MWDEKSKLLKYCYALLISNMILFSQEKIHAQTLNQFNLNFSSQGNGSEASMILGNGDVTVNAWVDKHDNNLYFYIGKSDSHTEHEDLYKVGKVKVSFYPNILVEDSSYLETFRIADANYLIKTKYAAISIRVDANNPVILFDAKTSIPAKMTVTAQLMRKPEANAPEVGGSREVA